MRASERADGGLSSSTVNAMLMTGLSESECRDCSEDRGPEKLDHLSPSQVKSSQVKSSHLFHFFECPHGMSDAARVACCSALEQHAVMLCAPRAGDGEGEGDLHLELAWARATMLAKRQPGELGRYRRYLAAKALAGAFAMPAASSVKEAVMDSLHAGVVPSVVEDDDAVEGDDDEREGQRGSASAGDAGIWHVAGGRR